MRINVYATSNPGLVREHNEDYFFVSPTEPLYVVADGMGGHNCGEVASLLAAETLEEFYQKTAGQQAVDLTPERTRRRIWPFGRRKRTLGFEEDRMEAGIQLANTRIWEAAQADPAKQGMGTTIVACYFANNAAFVGHVGDSRCYLLRDGVIRQVTEDHSLANEYVKMNILSREDAAHFPYKNVIVRALGLADHVQVDIQQEEFEMGDLFLLCSDGLCDMVTPQEMVEVIRMAPSVGEAAEELVRRACQAGGVDNITVILARIDPD